MVFALNGDCIAQCNAYRILTILKLWLIHCKTRSHCAILFANKHKVSGVNDNGLMIQSVSTFPLLSSQFPPPPLAALNAPGLSKSSGWFLTLKSKQLFPHMDWFAVTSFSHCVRAWLCLCLYVCYAKYVQSVWVVPAVWAHTVKNKLLLTCEWVRLTCSTGRTRPEMRLHRLWSNGLKLLRSRSITCRWPIFYSGGMKLVVKMQSVWRDLCLSFVR